MKSTVAAGLVFHSLVLWSLVTGMAVADESPRVWTDVKNRQIEAKLLAVENDKIRVLFKGKEVMIPILNLSEADRTYLEEWKASSEKSDVAEKPAPTGSGGVVPKPETGNATFDGKPLVLGGKVNEYEYEYTAEAREDLVKKYKAEDTGFRIGVAAPVGFDPSKPQKLLVVMSPGNNDAQMAAGNIRSLKQFAQRGVNEGWVCIAYNSNLGLPTSHYGSYNQAIEKLQEIWPGMSGWTIATGGISGGAKGACINVNTLTARGLPVRGLFLQGCNDAGNLVSSRDTFKVSKKDLREVRCFISTGKNDNLVSPNHVKGVVNTLKTEGIKTIKEEWYEGGHELNLDHLAIALAWFSADAP